MQDLKRQLYFPLAGYFRFWARIRLSRWQPRVILVTGSSGKTTLLHLIEAQLGTRAHYSHLANSAFGVPFDILDLHPDHQSRSEWLGLLLSAPKRAFLAPYKQKLYVVEADSDRPGEAKFLANLLKPEVTIWLSSDKSHSASFDAVVNKGQATSVETAIAQEFGNYLKATTGQVIVNGDSELIMSQTDKLIAKVAIVNNRSVSGYKLGKADTNLAIEGQSVSLPALIPEAAGLSVAAVRELCNYLSIEMDTKFRKFTLPSGRSSVLNGIKGSTIIDSSYNAIPDAVREMLSLFGKYPGQKKWLVLSDMVEQGQSEKSEHERLAAEIAQLKLDHLILIGPRMTRYTLPKLQQLNLGLMTVTNFDQPAPALAYIKQNLTGGEAIMFKGARFLEGIIEPLLANPKDADKLCRRGVVWQRRRERWGL